MRQAPALSTGSASKYTSPSNHQLSWRFFYGGRPQHCPQEVLLNTLHLQTTSYLGDSFTEDDPCCGTATTACQWTLCIFSYLHIFIAAMLSVLHLRTSCEYQP